MNMNNTLQEQIADEIKIEISKWMKLTEKMNNIKQELKKLNVEKQDIEKTVLDKMKSFDIKFVDLDNGSKIALTKSKTKKILKTKRID